MNWKTYKKTLERDLVGRLVRTLKPMKNGFVNIPSGTLCTITRKWSGLKLETQACLHCGVSVYITKVDPNKVVLLSEEGKDAR